MAKTGRLGTCVALAALLFAGSAPPARAQRSAPFDLTGPRVDIHVTRDGKTLPIASVPNLRAGDRLWLHPDLPATQSVHYLLVVCFLRGTTNPPPDNWFIKIETWNQKVREEGFSLRVPDEAQQAVLFLAPETGGDFSTLRSAVRGRPGIFVRASQDLTEAGFEQARIEKYLNDMRQVPPSDSKALHKHSDLIARTLNLKPDESCFSRPVDMQFTCLTQSGNQTLLDDGHGESIVSSLSGGENGNFIRAASYTSIGGAGAYSAYVGAVVDLVHIMGNLHTAQYQYIPAIAFPEGDSLNLRLNTPPSFHNPKSVIVIGLPSIQKAVPPPLRPADPNEVTCLAKPSVSLPVEGAPLVFSTAFAHDLVLHVNENGHSEEIPLVPDAYRGGLTLSARQEKRKVLSSDRSEWETPKYVTKDIKVKALPGAVTGTVTGYWGFDPFTGPTMQLQTAPGKDWKMASGSVLIAGRKSSLSLTSTGSACVQSITLDTDSGKHIDTDWKLDSKPNVVDVKLSLENVDPGPMHLAIRQYGVSKPDLVAAETYSEPATLSSLKYYAGDTSAILTGTNLGQVKQVTLKKYNFAPAPEESFGPEDDSSSSHKETLRVAMSAKSGDPKLKANERLIAHVTLKDGRQLSLPVVVDEARPSVSILNKRITGSSSSIHLANPDDLPANDQLTFSLKCDSSFPRAGKIEIANADGSLHTVLDVAAGTLILQNHHTLLGTLDPTKAFGTSAFGPLRLRAVAPDGTKGDWIPLITLVRLPSLDNVRCPMDSSQPCTLSGDGLYLVDSVATNSGFTNPTEVPEGFIGTTLSLPRPSRSGFFLKLRDDPSAVNAVNIPVYIPRPAAPKPKPVVKKTEPEVPASPTTEPAATEPATGENPGAAVPAGNNNAAPSTVQTPPAQRGSPAAPASPAGQSACTSGTCPPPEKPAAPPQSTPAVK